MGRTIITKRKFLITVISIGLLIGIASSFINQHINKAYNHKIYSQINSIPNNKVALLLGTSKTFNGRGNLYFITRINAVAKLYHAKK